MLFTENIKRHIKREYNVEFDDIKLEKFFGMRGFILEELDRWDPYGVITLAQAAAIWEITLI